MNEFIATYVCPYYLKTIKIKQSEVELKKYKKSYKFDIESPANANCPLIYKVYYDNCQLFKTEKLKYSKFACTNFDDWSIFMPICCFSRQGCILPLIASCSNSYCFSNVLKVKEVDKWNTIKIFLYSSKRFLIIHLKTHDKLIRNLSDFISTVIKKLFNLSPNKLTNLAISVIRLIRTFKGNFLRFENFCKISLAWLFLKFRRYLKLVHFYYQKILQKNFMLTLIKSATLRIFII